LLDEGHRAAVKEHEQATSDRRAAITRTSGIFTGIYGPDSLAQLREDWPA
jgi:hypothetical protein